MTCHLINKMVTILKSLNCDFSLKKTALQICKGTQEKDVNLAVNNLWLSNKGLDGINTARRNFPQTVQETWKHMKINLHQRKWSVYSDI